MSNGIEVLLDDLPQQLQSSNLACFGIIVDADEDIEARWQALSKRIIRAGQVDFPQQPKASGTIIEVDQGYRTIKVGLWLMPNNKLPGMLEDFIKVLVPTEDKLWLHVEACLAQIVIELIESNRKKIISQIWKARPYPPLVSKQWFFKALPSSQHQKTHKLSLLTPLRLRSLIL